MNIPNGLPTLSAGAHRPGEGKACVMEYVSLLAGEAWTDMPSCTNGLLACAAQGVNDRLLDEDRHLLVPLIGRLFGTDAPVDRRVFALRIARTVEHLTPGAKAWNDVTERFLAGGATVDELRAAHASACAASASAATSAAHAAYASASAARLLAAHAASASATSAATDARPTELVEWLASIIDIYDELAGRDQHRVVSDQELAALAEAVMG